MRGQGLKPQLGVEIQGVIFWSFALNLLIFSGACSRRATCILTRVVFFFFFCLLGH